MINEALKKFKLPEVLKTKNGSTVETPGDWLLRKDEIIELLSREVYGFSPEAPEKVSCEILETESSIYAGKAIHSLLKISFMTPKGEFSFPVNLFIPKRPTPPPVFLHIAFRPDVPDRYFPVEEILDGGFATASFCYKDVAPDCYDNFEGGLAGMYRGNTRLPDEWGKVSMWAWAAQRVMDYLQTREDIDKSRIAVVGHSRLGKTALWCAAQDERFAAGISNESGCSGAAITREKEGERVKEITRQFGYWFCDNYKKYIDNEANMPFDQHYLLSAIAPKLVYVSSAWEDKWADPRAEFLSCAAAGEVFEMLGLKGFIAPDRLPEPGINLYEGNIGYHLREGLHFLSRYDWQRFMEFLKVKGW